MWHADKMFRLHVKSKLCLNSLRADCDCVLLYLTVCTVLLCGCCRLINSLVQHSGHLNQYCNYVCSVLKSVTVTLIFHTDCWWRNCVCMLHGQRQRCACSHLQWGWLLWWNSTSLKKAPTVIKESDPNPELSPTPPSIRQQKMLLLK